jgi:hypothetical protein
MAVSPRTPRIITLLSDFGTRDEYAAGLKASFPKPMKFTSTGNFLELWFLNGNNFKIFFKYVNFCLYIDSF